MRVKRTRPGGSAGEQAGHDHLHAANGIHATGPIGVNQDRRLLRVRKQRRNAERIRQRQREGRTLGHVRDHRLQIHLKFAKANGGREFGRTLPMVPDRIAPGGIRSPLLLHWLLNVLQAFAPLFFQFGAFRGMLLLNFAPAPVGAIAKLDGFRIE